MATVLGAETEAGLRAAGLDLVAEGAEGRRAAVLVGNSRALWPPFVAWLRRSPSRAEGPQPLDTYVRETLGSALAGAPVPVLRVVHPTDRDAPDFVGLAVRFGLLWKSPGGLGVHPVFGPWVALRALVVVDAPAGPSPPPCPACPHCASACGPAFASLPRPASEAAFRAVWRTWADARSACPTGAAHRYSDDQLAYHYTHDRALLRTLARGPSPEGVEP